MQRSCIFEGKNCVIDTADDMGFLFVINVTGGDRFETFSYFPGSKRTPTSHGT